MPAGIAVELDGGFATLDFLDPKLRGPALQALVEIDGGASIESITRDGPRKKYRVPEGNARTAGLVDGSTVVPPNDSAGQDTGHADRLKNADHTGPYPFPTSRNKWSTGDPAVTTPPVTPPAEGGDGAQAQGFTVATPTYPEGEPNESWTNAQIKDYAADHDIDLGSASTKAEYLAAIDAAAAVS